MYNPSLHFHFVGVGGVGMSGLAAILINQGFKVSGSDLSYGAACERLEALGVTIYREHSASNLAEDVSSVVYSSAIPKSNPELTEAEERGVPVIPRAEVLAELMRLKFGVAVAGSHGKTSTSSLVASVLEDGDLDPTVIIGGKVHNYGSTGKLGRSEYLVAEADESDRSFLLLKPTIAIVTNIDDEHLIEYGDIESIEKAFSEFITSVPFYGLAILCSDDPRIRKISEHLNCRKITYGINSEADITASLVSMAKDSTVFDAYYQGDLLGRITLPMIGEHFMQNALAAIAVGLEFKVPFEKIQLALNSFQGVSRRVELLGKRDGVTIINDYAHHPTEIRATLKAVDRAYRNGNNNICVLFQPHRYSRTKDCWKEFKDSFTKADKLFVTDVYSAGESPIDGYSASNLVEHIGHSNSYYIGDLSESLDKLDQHLKSDDLLICMGAGSIGTFASNLIK